MEPLDSLINLLPSVLSLGKIERNLKGGKLLGKLGWRCNLGLVGL